MEGANLSPEPTPDPQSDARSGVVAPVREPVQLYAAGVGAVVVAGPAHTLPKPGEIPES